MKAPEKNLGLLAKLGKALTANRDITARAKETLDLTCAASPRMKPSLWHKIKDLLLQIFFLKAKEKKLIDTIDSIEQKHKQMRRKGMLRKASPDGAFPDEAETRKKEQRRRDLWLALLALILFNGPKKKKKDESLTPR